MVLGVEPVIKGKEMEKTYGKFGHLISEGRLVDTFGFLRHGPLRDPLRRVSSDLPEFSGVQLAFLLK